MSYAVQTNKLCKQIGDKHILDKVSLSIKSGEIYGFLGANGAGKTSFIKILMGLYHKTSGEVRIFGYSMDGNNERFKNLYRDIGYIVEVPVFYTHLSVNKNLMIYCDYLDCSYSKIPKILELVGLQNCEKMLTKEMSLGMRQRLAIGRALLADPKLLLLDEPINGLDPHGIKEFRQLMKQINSEAGTTILISSHILSEISKIADTVGIIHKGKILSQISLDQVGADENSLEDYYFNLLRMGGMQ
ncbi:ABC transporter ATP-binding protein [Clostridium rectalis]|uniref:ABC transporter ATP-binding protein n=1 Tax=Clostridium rectalis TaxID=2040295 RepID=UPI000F638061|nr:ATP-binding cassette domain-containing protein [Clostridium rectalis]